MEGYWLIVFGNPIDGFTYRGPFSSREEAIEYGNAVGEADWWVTELSPPDMTITRK